MQGYIGKQNLYALLHIYLVDKENMNYWRVFFNYSYWQRNYQTLQFCSPPIIKRFWHSVWLSLKIFHSFASVQSSMSEGWIIISFLHWFLSSGKVQEEIEQVIGSNPPRIEHRTQMPYTDAVIHEVQRFANILPLDLPHETAEDVTLKDYFIPKVRCLWDCFF